VPLTFIEWKEPRKKRFSLFVANRCQPLITAIAICLLKKRETFLTERLSYFLLHAADIAANLFLPYFFLPILAAIALAEA
jgi:hypothetical protein